MIIIFYDEQQNKNKMLNQHNNDKNRVMKERQIEKIIKLYIYIYNKRSKKRNKI